jgi:hypothetical protein
LAWVTLMKKRNIIVAHEVIKIRGVWLNFEEAVSNLFSVCTLLITSRQSLAQKEFQHQTGQRTGPAQCVAGLMTCLALKSRSANSKLTRVFNW